MKKLVAVFFSFLFSLTALNAASQTTSRKMSVCIADPIELCGESEFKLPSPEAYVEHVKAFCTMYGKSSKQVAYMDSIRSNVSGGRIGVTRLDVTCRPQPWPTDSSARKTTSYCVSDGTTSCSNAPQGTASVGCRNAAAHTKALCKWSDGSVGNHYIKPISNAPGGQCGATLFEVTCLLE